jgi:TolB protein
LLSTAYYQQGLQLLTADSIDEALLAFEEALAERPNASDARAERAKATLYVDGKAAEETDMQKAVEAFRQLYREDEDYLDVGTRLLAAYEQLGDELAEAEEWCLAEAQYLEANRLKPSDDLQVKADTSNEQCAEMTLAEASGGAPQGTPKAAAVTNGGSGSAAVAATPSLTSTTAANPSPTGGGSDLIYFAAYNPFEARWEILAVPAGGGTRRVVTINGTMPAVSPDGRWLIYHSELIDAEGFHRLDLTSGEDTRITQFQRHILPRWGSDNSSFVFVAQEPGTGRWQVQLGFADGKSGPIILRDGRTPDWSSTGLLAYQGTDPAGNDPGLYIVPFDGGEETRLTTHESDRSPDFSPDGTQLAYMSTKGGNWDIYTINTAGSAPRQITTSAGQDGLPAWSPDGSQIAYVSDAGGSWAIYVVNAAGGTPIKVADWDGNNFPDWLLAQIWWAR